MVERIRDVEQMPVYQSFSRLAFAVESEMKDPAWDFRWLRVQVLRSSESVLANMAEGFYSQYSTEYLQALYRSRREARETIAHLRYARGVGVLTNDVARRLITEYEQALQQLANVITSIERKIMQRGKSKELPSMVKEESWDYDVEPSDMESH